jgi:hypothetical protein
MGETDNPLKQLVESNIADFAEWLLGAEVRAVQPLNTELTGHAVRTDQLYRVVLASGRALKLHLEFQGLRTHEPMPLRMLDYMARLVRIDADLDLHSAVLYLGRGAGARDEGIHQVLGVTGQPVMIWRYQVIRLWQMQAEELLALQRPALLLLVGQMRIDSPNEVWPAVVANLKSISDDAMRQRLFTSLLALVEDQEWIEMLEKFVEEDDLPFDSPFLRRIREKARAEAITEGVLLSRREDILEVILWRFDPPASAYQQIQQMLARINDPTVLASLHKTAVQASEFAQVQEAFHAVIGSDTTQGVSETKL